MAKTTKPSDKDVTPDKDITPVDDLNTQNRAIIKVIKALDKKRKKKTKPNL